MHKYAAATALAITLSITMLAPAVSSNFCPADGPVGYIYCLCARQCGIDSVRDYAVAAAGARLALERKYQACSAKCVNASEATRRRAQAKTPSPGTKESLVRFIHSMQMGQPNYDEMSPAVAAANRSQVSRTGPLMKSLGPLKSITFRTVDARGFDVYDATFKKGRAEFSIAPLTSDGKVAARVWHILQTS
jgi:hypothetical protein